MEKEKIYEKLNSGVVSFKYEKLDGSIREATGTCNLDIISTVAELPSKTEENKDVIRYFDMDKLGWRSFRVENFLNFV